ncbi:hypothetical protein P3S68_012884 [Capsicum galapagoense]
MVFALPSMARPYGFRPAMISSLARSVGFRPSMNSSSLILCHSRPNGGSTTFATATHTEEIARRSVQLPWLMLQPPESTSVYKFYRMSKNDVKVVAVGSTQDPSDSYSQFLGSPFLGWMAYIRRKDCHFIRNLLSGSVESYTTYHTAGGRRISPQMFSESIIKVVVLSSSPMDDDCIAKLFYTLSYITDELEAWDLHSDPIKRFHFHEDQTGVLGSRRFPIKKYVHCVPHIHPDSLPYKTLGFDVFKFDFINDHHLVKLSLLEDIGDRAIFLDKRRCFAFSTTQFPELRPGSIYFADGNYKWKYNFGGHDMGICNYADDRIIDQIPFPSHTWFIPDVDVDF